MKWKKIVALGCVIAMATASVTGCGTTKEENTTTEQSEKEESTVTVKVTAVDGDTITASVGEITQQEAPSGEAPSGEAPEKPDGDNATSGDSTNGEAPSGEAPEKPDGDNATGGDSTNGEAPSGEAPEKPDGDNATGGDSTNGEAPSGEAPEKPDGEAPQGIGGSTFTAGDESITFTLTDDTAITVEYLQGSDDGTADDIAVGSVLEVTLDADNQAETVVVKNLNAGGGFGGSDEVTNGTAANTIDEDSEISEESYTSNGDDENALRVDGATVTLDGITVDKTGGESSNTENGDFYGQNAGLLALNGAQVTISNANINTSAKNGNAVFSYGEGTVVNISDSTIRTTENNSGGIQTTGGGTTNATNLDVETQGNSAAAIRSDRGGGTVNVEGGSYVTNGNGSPAIYCTADINVSDATLTANASEGVVVEGKNTVALKNCDVTGDMDNTYNGDSDENIHCIMIYQSMSGDAAVGEASFSADGGSITAKTGDMFYITNTDCTIDLKDVALTLANDTLLRIEGNSSSRGWGTEGANGGDVVMTAESQTMSGNILVDSISSLNLTMKSGTNYTGAINPDGAEGTVDVTLDKDSTWTLTGDSYITSFDGDTSCINTNGYHLYVNGEQVL